MALRLFLYYVELLQLWMKVNKGTDTQKAFTTAREECIKQGYLKGFIEKEGFIMFYKDIFDYDTQLREEGIAEGEARGKAQGITKMIELIKSGITPDDAVKLLLGNQEEQPAH